MRQTHESRSGDLIAISIQCDLLTSHPNDDLLCWVLIKTLRNDNDIGTDRVSKHRAFNFVWKRYECFTDGPMRFGSSFKRANGLIKGSVRREKSKKIGQFEMQ